ESIKMKKIILYVSTLALAFCIFGNKSMAAEDETNGAAMAATAQIVAAANAFLATLDDKQRAAVLYQFDDEKQRARWSNFPTGFVRRGGLSMAELTDAQQKAVLALLAAH